MAIQHKRGTKAQWLASSFILAPGQTGVATDTGEERYGNGTNLWKDLPKASTREGILRVTDFGVTGTANDTATFQAAVNAASPLGANVLVPPGYYAVEGLTIPNGVVLQGASVATSRFSLSLGNASRKSSVTLTRPGALAPNNTSTATMVTVPGAGAGLRNIHLDGRSAPGTVLVMQGFETVLDSVRIISGGGIGLDVQKANNTRWQFVMVDDCGGAAANLPAVKIWSKSGVGTGGNETNTLDILGLTIERSKNVALEIAVGPSSGENWAEWVRILNLHVEASYLDGAGGDAPLIRIGNVRALTFVDPFIYGGNNLANGCIIRHEEQATRTYGQGGVRFIGGTILGPDVAAGAPAMPLAVDLVTGNDISFSGTKLMRYSTAAVKVRSTYGADVQLDPTTMRASRSGGLPVIADDRATKTLVPLSGDVEVQGHITQKNVAPGNAGINPTIAGQSGTTGANLQNASDARGRALWGTTATPVSGMQLIVTFAKPYAAEPVVTLTPGNAATAALGLYVAATANDLRVYAANVPTASQGSTTYQVAYHVIG